MSGSTSFEPFPFGKTFDGAPQDLGFGDIDGDLDSVTGNADADGTLDGDSNAGRRQHFAVCVRRPPRFELSFLRRAVWLKVFGVSSGSYSLPPPMRLTSSSPGRPKEKSVPVDCVGPRKGWGMTMFPVPT